MEKLMCKPEQSEKLVSLGVLPECFFWWFLEEDDTDMNDAGESPLKWRASLMLHASFMEGQCVPAWTKGELDAMTGPFIPKTDMFTKSEFGTSRTIDAETYPIFSPSAMTTYTNGAEAAAWFLIWAIENKHVTVDAINKRYKKLFK